MRKRISKRRWKARCRIGRQIPATAIIEHDLNRWFVFVPCGFNTDVWRALPNMHPRMYPPEVSDG